LTDAPKRATVFKTGAAILGAAILALAGALAWIRYAPRRVPAGQPSLAVVDDRSIEPVRAAFDAGAGEIRILALLSPT
jgi:hypothetical protein